MNALAGPVWLIGGGKMGSALAEGWLAGGLPTADLVIVDPADTVRAAWRSRGTTTLATPSELGGLNAPLAVVLAVKPQQMTGVLATIAPLIPATALVVSIAAGTPLKTFAGALGDDQPLVRAMPNTPAAVGRGATALVANAAAGPTARAFATALMAAVGVAVWLEDEADMHAVTALSGSGPAYVFLLIEAMTAAGTRLGLSPSLAEQLAHATVAGAGELARTSEAGAGELRRNVTSPGGTTAAALDVLMHEAALEDLVARAMTAAARRSDELGRPEPSA